MIADLAHVELRVPDPEACAAYAERVLGLRVAARDAGGAVVMTCDRAAARVTYLPGEGAALERVGLLAEGPAALEALAGRLDRAGVAVEQVPGERLRFASPDGHPFEVVAALEAGEPAWYPTPGLRPTRFGHVTLTAPDIAVTEQFLVELLGFRVSDRIVPGIGSWLRCSSEHHVLGILQGPVAGLHHYAFDVEDLSGLGRLGDLLDGNGRRLLFGPGRHGPGNNLFTYHLDPAGICVEVVADMQKVLDEAGHEPGAWPATAETENLWGPLAPAGFDDLCAPNAPVGEGAAA